MSAAIAIRNPSALGGFASRPALSVIDHRQQRTQTRRRQAMLAIFIFVLAGFFAVATAHAELVSNQRDLDGLRQQITEASATNAAIQRQVDEASSPEEIVERAGELGMVRAADPVYLVASGPIRESIVPVLMEPPPSEDEMIIAAPAAPRVAEAPLSAIAGSRAVSVGLSAG